MFGETTCSVIFINTYRPIGPPSLVVYPTVSISFRMKWSKHHFVKPTPILNQPHFWHHTQIPADRVSWRLAGQRPRSSRWHPRSKCHWAAPNLRRSQVSERVAATARQVTPRCSGSSGRTCTRLHVCPCVCIYILYYYLLLYCLSCICVYDLSWCCRHFWCSFFEGNMYCRIHFRFSNLGADRPTSNTSNNEYLMKTCENMWPISRIPSRLPNKMSTFSCLTRCLHFRGARWKWMVSCFPTRCLAPRNMMKPGRLRRPPSRTFSSTSGARNLESRFLS